MAKIQARDGIGSVRASNKGIRMGRTFISALPIAGSLFINGAAVAQTAPEPPPGISPLRVAPDNNGANITTGKISIDVPSLGVPAAPRLNFDLLQKAAPYINGTINITLPDSPVKGAYTVQTYGGQSDSFQCVDGDCKSTARTGSFLLVSLSPSPGGMSAIYQRAQTGETYTYDLVNSDATGGSTRTVQSYASSIGYPDGEVISFTYQTYVFVQGGHSTTFYRPTQIQTNAGYFITISYVSGTFGTNEWSMPAQATLYATAAPSTPLQQLNYNFSNTTHLTTITDLWNRIWVVGGTLNQMGNYVESSAGSVQLPTETFNQLTIAQNASYPLVASVTRDGVAWSYSYVSPGLDPNSGDYLYSKLTATGPNGYSMAYDMVTRNHHNVIAKSTDALGRFTTYTTDSDGRVTDITLPETNSVHVDYDARSNIISKTTHAKVGSGLADITETASYPNALTCSDVLCWRPNSATDALTRVTNYSWNGDGQLTQQLDPADAAGVRRETDITYTTAGISRKALVRVCGQTTTCSATAESHIEYTYWNNTALPLTATHKDEATGATRVTTYSYDSAGRVTMVDGPLSGTDDAKYVRYDQYGRKIWEIGEAATNGTRVGTTFTYRTSDDKVTNVQTGKVSCTTDCATAPTLTLTNPQQTDTTYDSRRYAIRETNYQAATTYRVIDRSFLDRGLADCTTVRMDLAAPLAGACSLGTAGADGSDRITKNLYDNAGQLLKVQKAYGTSLQQDYVTYTYTNNGKQQTVTDANGNKAQYTYDGFDRLTKWAFPDKVTVGAVSPTDYEQYAYDAVGNRTCLRKRDGSKLTYTYDNLNRMTSKVGTLGSWTCP